MQGFLTAVLQNHARLTQTSIDQLSFGFSVRPEQEAGQVASGPSSGAYLFGLHLEGARYISCACCCSHCLMCCVVPDVCLPATSLAQC